MSEFIKVPSVRKGLNSILMVIDKKLSISMGRHKEWRKIAKRERRRQIRMKMAKERDCMQSPSCQSYKEWLLEQEYLEKFELEQIHLNNQAENEKWVQAEKITLENLKRIAKEKEQHHRKQIEQQIKLQQEWELEKKRKEQEAERLRLIEEETKLKQEKFMTSLEEFLNGYSSEPPQELLIYHETRPNLELCPFFNKTACCRFGDQCSRNHQVPGISKILLATNFYMHFGLENANFNEYDTDVMLEYEDSDTYRQYKEFYEDVLPEFQKHGQVIQFQVSSCPRNGDFHVCNNYEKHLRGNTYVEYADLRSAVQAYRALHARWYGGRQISLQFCQISSWKTAICGLQARKQCPKGRACNFLHVFTNPGKLYDDRQKKMKRAQRTPKRSWRWSESPERLRSQEKRSTSKGKRKEDSYRKSKSDRRTRRCSKL